LIHTAEFADVLLIFDCCFADEGDILQIRNSYCAILVVFLGNVSANGNGSFSDFVKSLATPSGI